MIHDQIHGYRLQQRRYWQPCFDDSSLDRALHGGIAEVINFVLIPFKPDFFRFDFPNHLCCKTVKIDV